MAFELPKTKTVDDAAKALVDAKQKRIIAEEEKRDGTGYAALYSAEANMLEDFAADILNLHKQPVRVSGGELNDPSCRNPADWVQEPNALTLEASRKRLELVSHSNCLSLAVDAAQTVGAKDSLEKMLVHQMAVAHKVGLELMITASKNIMTEGGFVRNTNPDEIVKLVNASARLMDVFQKGMLTLNKIRTGGKQTVVVQHVHVSNSGQAIVAGTVNKGEGAGCERS